MFITPAIFFILSEIYLFFNTSWFWLLILVIFSYFTLRSKAKEEFEYFRALIVPILFLFLNLYLYRVIDFSFPVNQIYLIILAAIFAIFLKIYSQKNRQSYAFHIIPLITSGLLAFIFFHADLSTNFFLKEALLFLGIVILMEGDRKIFSIFEKPLMIDDEQKVNQANEIKISEINSPTDFASKPIAFSIVASMVLVELAWILNFLPINFVSLAGIWLVGFFLTRETALLFHKKLFSWRIFLPELALMAILLVIIMTTATWRIY
jgi:hypothetical protein